MTKIVFIGAGNLASHLVFALYGKDIEISQIFSRTEKSARFLAEKVNANYTTDIAEIDRTADIYIYSVSDSVLPELAAAVNIPDALHIHTSGSTEMEIFNKQAKHFGVLYPLQTFSKSKAVSFSEVPLFIEGNDEYSRSKIEKIARTLSSKLYFMDSTGRMKLHLSAVFACNFVNHLYEIGSELVGDAGVGFDVLLPLIEETMEKIKTLSPYAAQTGPAVRNDRNIARKHLALLNGKRTLSEIYQMITEDIYSIHNKPQ